MDYFNEAERRKQKDFAAWRDGKLAPFLSAATRAGLRPYHITIISVLCLVGAVLLPITDAPFGYAALILAYCLLDGLDGPLARRQGSSHEGGAMLDIAADQAGVALVAAAATHHLGSNGIAAVLFAGSYLSFIALALYANRCAVTLWPFIRIKYFFYFIYFVSGVIALDLAQYLMAAFAAYYSAYIVHALVRIYSHFQRNAVGTGQ